LTIKAKNPPPGSIFISVLLSITKLSSIKNYEFLAGGNIPVPVIRTSGLVPE